MSDSPVTDDLRETLFTAESICARVAELGVVIAAEYAVKRPLVLVTLSGAAIFAADLVRAITPTPPGLQVDFIRASSYRSSTTSSGAVDVQDCSKIDPRGRHVLIVEDIVDTGHTLLALTAAVAQRGAASVKSVVLLDKAERRVADMQADFVGFKCPDQFVVGYGLDFNEHYRSLPFIGVLKEACYSAP